MTSLRICLVSADIHPCVPLIDLTTIQLLKEWIILSSGISYQRKLLPQRQRSASAYKFQFSPGMSHQIAPYLLLFYTPILMVDTRLSLTSKYVTQTEHRDWLIVTRQVLVKLQFRKVKPWTRQPSLISIRLSLCDFLLTNPMLHISF